MGMVVIGLTILPVVGFVLAIPFFVLSYFLFTGRLDENCNIRTRDPESVRRSASAVRPSRRLISSPTSRPRWWVEPVDGSVFFSFRGKSRILRQPIQPTAAFTKRFSERWSGLADRCARRIRKREPQSTDAPHQTRMVWLPSKPPRVPEF